MAVVEEQRASPNPDIPAAFFLSTTTRASTTAGKNNSAMPRNSTRWEALLREFANDGLSPDALRQRASILLGSKDLVRNALSGMTQEQLARLIDKFDQVCRVHFFFPLGTLIHRFCAGIPQSRPAKRENVNCFGELV